jgi:hypothetical protein
MPYFRTENDLMKYLIRSATIILAGIFAMVPVVADDPPTADHGIRILSWNISGDAFTSEQEVFQSLLLWANPDVVLLDEVDLLADPEDLIKALAALRPGKDKTWNIDVGKSGGRQRGLIASHAPLEPLREFSSIVPYPESDKRQILERMSLEDRTNADWSMEGGIPVNGAVIRVGDRRLLTVVADLQCCGDSPESWQELRRRVEAREIRRLIGQVLERTRVDGVVFAGDFNMVNSTFPMALLAGPYPTPHSGLIPAELYHSDGDSTWTWDGRRTPFPSNTLDYQLYGPSGLKTHSGFILDTESISYAQRHQLGLEMNASKRTGRHRPLVVEYHWSKARCMQAR